MKLSEDTLTIFKNFSTINPNLVIKPGNEISTIAEAKNILASAKVSDTFDREFGIYDLNEFLNVLSLFNGDCDLEFNDKSVEVKNGNTSCLYYYADPSILTSPTKSITMPAADVTINISADILNQIKRGANTIGQVVVSFVGDNGKVSLVAKDPKNPGSNQFSIVIDEANDNKEKFDLQFLINNIKVLNGDYKVEISQKLISKWSIQTGDIEYFIALEKTSTYGG